MSLRKWLLTGTSLTLLVLTPLGVARAQDATDPGLESAFANFRAEQNSTTQQALKEACIGAGFQSLDECIAALTGLAPADREPAAEAPASEPESKAEEPAQAPEKARKPDQKKPAAEKPARRPAAEAPVASEPEVVAPEPAPAPEPEKPAPEKKKPAPAPAPAPEQAVEQPVEKPAEKPAREKPAPTREKEKPAPSKPEAAPSQEEVAPPPAVEEPAPAKGGGALAQLQDAVDLYNQGVAELDADRAGGQAKVDAARAQIDAICGRAGFADVTACLAQFGLALSPLPPAAEQPVVTPSEKPAVSEEPSVTEPPTVVDEPAPREEPVSEEPISEMPRADEPVNDQATEVLPESVPAAEAAPILDSAKDTENATGAPESETAREEAPVAPVAPPADDKVAQEDIKAPPPEVQSALTDKGTERKGRFDFGFAEPPVPPVPSTPSKGDKDKGRQPPEKVVIVEKPTKEKPSFIFQIGINLYISNVQQERDRFYNASRDSIYYEDLSGGRVRETIERPDGTRIVTIYNRYGEVLQRTKVDPDNREFYLATYDPRDDADNSFYLDPGADLPPLRLTIPASQYILDADTATADQVEFFLDQPPVEKVRRIYSIDEVKRSARIRDSVRRLEVGGLTFDTGKATISRDQVTALSKVANAMTAMLDKNPAEVFLIEGHTDAVGSEVSNLVLSDQRAATVARILSDFYEIPPENLVTQGYGERYLKVKTEAAEKLNRRVTIKRITPLVSYDTGSR